MQHVDRQKQKSLFTYMDNLENVHCPCGYKFREKCNQTKSLQNLSIASMGYAVYLCTLCMEESNISEK